MGRKVLFKRGFPKEGIKTLYVAGGERDPSDQGAAVLNCVAGIYYEKRHNMNNRQLYQQVAAVLSPTKIVCSPLHIFWCSARSAWKIGLIDTDTAAFGLNTQDKNDPQGLDSGWQILLSQQEQMLQHE